MRQVYGFITEHAGEFPVAGMCRALGVSRSGYTRHASARRGARALGDEVLGRRILEIFGRHRRRYGARRIHRQLRAEGESCGLGRVRRLMRSLGLRPLQKRGFVPRTTLGGGRAPFPNLLLGHPGPSSVNEVWVGDITFIPLSGGRWAYLAMLMDLCSRRVLAWELGGGMGVDLVLRPLRRACRSRGRHEGLILHSDQGSQYGAGEYRRAAASAGMRQSMSRRANCYDNAFMESCFGTIKCEMLEGGVFGDIGDARTEIFDYIESYYNTERLHSSLGYRTPADYEDEPPANR